MGLGLDFDSGEPGSDWDFDWVLNIEWELRWTRKAYVLENRVLARGGGYPEHG